jgi:DNA replication protein DnaC
MRYYETSFEDYINSCNEYNIHPEPEKKYATLTKSIYQLENIIMYGPNGVGKYTQMLRLLSRYSPSKLKYEKKNNSYQ